MQDQICPYRLLYIIILICYTFNDDKEAWMELEKSLLQGTFLRVMLKHLILKNVARYGPWKHFD